MPTIDALPHEKREHVIDCAMREFTAMGYDKASTNSIVERAGISKGSIFQYFGSKRDMFFYLLDYTTRLMESYILHHPDIYDRDPLIRIKRTVLNLENLLDKYPSALEFLENAKTDQNRKIREEVIRRKRLSFESFTEMIFTDIDTDYLKPEIDVEMAKFVILSTLENLLKVRLAAEKKESFTAFTRRLNNYIEMFRQILYKEHDEK